MNKVGMHPLVLVGMLKPRFIDRCSEHMKSSQCKDGSFASCRIKRKDGGKEHLGSPSETAAA